MPTMSDLCRECRECVNEAPACEDCDACPCRTPRAHPATMIGKDS